MNGDIQEDLDRLTPCNAPEELRARVLDAVAAELSIVPSVPLRSWQDPGVWRMLAATAAAVLLWLNLSLSAVNATDGPPRPSLAHEPVDQMVKEIVQLLPELSYEEARRQVVLYQSGSDLLLCPEVPARPAMDPALFDLTGS